MRSSLPTVSISMLTTGAAARFRLKTNVKLPFFALGNRREYPFAPMVGAGAVVRRREKVLLMKRRRPPNEGLWTIPGGLVELGENLEGAAAREVFEETGLSVRIMALLDVQTDIHR